LSGTVATFTHSKRVNLATTVKHCNVYRRLHNTMMDEHVYAFSQSQDGKQLNS